MEKNNFSRGDEGYRKYRQRGTNRIIRVIPSSEPNDLAADFPRYHDYEIHRQKQTPSKKIKK